MDEERSFPIQTDADIVRARQFGRELASQLSFSPGDLTLISSVISELARNIFSYADRGEIRVSVLQRHGRSGVRIAARDEGPGIHDPCLALMDGFSTSGRLGLGLPGVKRLADEFTMESTVGVGTEIVLVKWLP